MLEQAGEVDGVEHRLADRRVVGRPVARRRRPEDVRRAAVADDRRQRALHPDRVLRDAVEGRIEELDRRAERLGDVPCRGPLHGDTATMWISSARAASASREAVDEVVGVRGDDEDVHVLGFTLGTGMFGRDFRARAFGAAPTGRFDCRQ